jgi:NADH:ubiquinone oxidoreductase subunit F (NADH-binding)/NADH:ubiquinone oxidoreductase subunit E
MKSLTERQLGTRIAKMLQEAQHRHGYISDDEIHRIANRVGEPVRVIQDVVSFFPHYQRSKPAPCRVAVCRDMSCRLRGSMQIVDQLRELQDAAGTEKIEVVEASCLGRCDRAPAMLVEQADAEPLLFVQRTPSELVGVVEQILANREVSGDSEQERAEEALSRSEIDCYRIKIDALSQSAPYSAVRQYLETPDPSRIIQALKTAGLLGMGGAGAPAYSKWDEARLATGEAKYVVCNADESEPGTFKDREILHAAPHLIIEGMIMAGLVIGANQGYIYVRHEYFSQIESVRREIERAESLGACGANIFGSGRTFRLEVFVSPGGYVCGEQTALIEALEGKRSEPRNRPPELQTNGLYDQPTVLNNVETFAWVPSILLREPTSRPVDTPESGTLGVWFKQAGKNRARGKRFFSISGDVRKPGAYEVPCGTLLGELIDEYAGGMLPGQALQAVALSGPSGGFLPALLPAKSLRMPKILDRDGKETDELKYPALATSPTDIRLLPLDIDASRELGFMLGAGIIVYGSEADMLEQALSCTQFYQRESCGKCVPCRLGSRKMVDMATLLADPSKADDMEMRKNVDALAKVMRTTSICGLGQVASEPLRTYLQYFFKSDR